MLSGHSHAFGQPLLFRDHRLAWIGDWLDDRSEQQLIWTQQLIRQPIDQLSSGGMLHGGTMTSNAPKTIGSKMAGESKMADGSPGQEGARDSRQDGAAKMMKMFDFDV